jgi:hypothetical protein
MTDLWVHLTKGAILAGHRVTLAAIFTGTPRGPLAVWLGVGAEA